MNVRVLRVPLPNRTHTVPIANTRYSVNGTPLNDKYLNGCRLGLMKCIIETRPLLSPAV